MNTKIPLLNIQNEILNRFKLDLKDLMNPGIQFDEIDWLELILFLEITFKKNMSDDLIECLVKDSMRENVLNVSAIEKILNESPNLEDNERNDRLKHLAELSEVQNAIPNSNKKNSFKKVKILN